MEIALKTRVKALKMHLCELWTLKGNRRKVANKTGKKAWKHGYILCKILWSGGGMAGLHSGRAIMKRKKIAASLSHDKNLNFQFKIEKNYLDQ